MVKGIIFILMNFILDTCLRRYGNIDTNDKVQIAALGIDLFV